MSKAPAPAEEAAPPAPKSKKLLIIVIVLVLVLLLAVAAVGMLLLKSKSGGEDEEAVEETAKPKKKAEPGKPPAFIPMDAFTVNLVQEQGEQFLQVVLSLRIEDSHEEPLIKNLMPQIRNDILRVLSSKRASELITVEGKDKLSEELKITVNRVIEPPAKGHEPEGPVQAVLFTSFIIQ